MELNFYITLDSGAWVGVFLAFIAAIAAIFSAYHAWVMSQQGQPECWENEPRNDLGNGMTQVTLLYRHGLPGFISILWIKEPGKKEMSFDGPKRIVRDTTPSFPIEIPSDKVDQAIYRLKKKRLGEYVLKVSY